MGRRLRSFAPGAVTHLTARGVDGGCIFLCDLDRFGFLALLRRVTERVDWQIVAWCLMDTHYHVVVVAPSDPRVSWGMQTLNSVYAREFNRRHGRRGHLFGERFTDTLVASERHLAAAVDYVRRNPVDAGLVRRVEDWQWSGDGRLEPRTPHVHASGTRLRRFDTVPTQSRDIPVLRRG